MYEVEGATPTIRRYQSLKQTKHENTKIVLTTNPTKAA